MRIMNGLINVSGQQGETKMQVQHACTNLHEC
jgi:hypothetical protein